MYVSRCIDRHKNPYETVILLDLIMLKIFSIEFLDHRYQERTLLLAGMIICFVGYFIFLPWGNDYPSVQIASMSYRINRNYFLRKQQFYSYFQLTQINL